MSLLADFTCQRLLVPHRSFRSGSAFKRRKAVTCISISADDQRLFSAFASRSRQERDPTVGRGASKVFKSADDAIADLKNGTVILSAGFGLSGVAGTSTYSRTKPVAIRCRRLGQILTLSQRRSSTQSAKRPPAISPLSPITPGLASTASPSSALQAKSPAGLSPSSATISP